MTIFWRRLGNPLAISWFSFAYIVLLQGSGSVVSSLVNYDGRLLEFLAVRLAAFVPLGLVLALGRLTLNRVAVSSPQPLITVAFLFLAICAGTGVFDFLLVFADFAEDYLFPRRLLTTLPGTMLGTVLIGLLVTAAHEQSVANARLLATAERLAALRGDIEKRISQRRQELVRDIRLQVEAQFARFGAHGSANANVVKDLIDDVVRPLSYSLAKNPRPARAKEIPIEEQQVAWGIVFLRAFRANPFAWRVQPLILGAIGATFLVLNFGLNGIVATAGLVLISAAIVALAQRLWTRLPAATPISLRVILFGLATTAITFAGAWIVRLVTGFSLFDPVKSPAWWIIVTVGMAAATLVLKIFRMLRATEVSLSATLKELKRELATLNTSLRQLHKSISRILHGPVQEAVSSMLIGLERHPERAESPEFSEQLRSRMSKALSLLDSATTRGSDPADVVSNLSELWADAAEISLSATPEHLQIIRDHPDTAYAVSEVVREACQNALRHGSATKIDVEIHLGLSNNSVEVIVRNTGTPLSPGARRGLGSQLFDDVSLHWTRHATIDGTELTASLPLIASPS